MTDKLNITPGPWEIDHGVGTTDVRGNDPTYISGMRVARIIDGIPKRRRANAAVPEYEALRAAVEPLVRWVESFYEADTCLRCGARNQAESEANICPDCEGRLGS